MTNIIIANPDLKPERSLRVELRGRFDRLSLDLSALPTATPTSSKTPA